MAEILCGAESRESAGPPQAPSLQPTLFYLVWITKVCNMYMYPALQTKPSDHRPSFPLKLPLHHIITPFNPTNLPFFNSNHLHPFHCLPYLAVIVTPFEIPHPSSFSGLKGKMTTISINVSFF